MTDERTKIKTILGENDATIDERHALSLLPRREAGAHKWGVGGLIVVGGAPGYVGAPALCAMAAGRVGAGAVVIAAPRGIVSAVAAIVPEASFIPLPDGDPRVSGRHALESIEERLVKLKAIVLGPGLGEDEYADALMDSLVIGSGARRVNALGFNVESDTNMSKSKTSGILGRGVPVVVDADGLNWFAKQGEWWSNLPDRSLVLTPHVGEMSRLLDCTAEEVTSDPIGAARAAAVRWKQIVVLKYDHSVVTDGDRAYVAPDAPLSLASAGTGDVLAGAIGGLLAQGVAPLDAAALALYVGARAARRVEARVGTLGLVASDLPLAMAEELRDMEGKRGERRD
ncbi:MAG: ADP-dependent NAD(P)H-hydrate dehydratase [Thermomicrobiales bacterium]